MSDEEKKLSIHITAMTESFLRELKSIINRYSRENGSDTPDFILAEYLNGCLMNFNYAVCKRENWYGRSQGVSVPQTAAPQAPAEEADSTKEAAPEPGIPVTEQNQQVKQPPKV